MKILVTGATGQDGIIMIEYLSKNTDHEIYGGVRKMDSNSLKYKQIALDLTDKVSIDHVINTIRPDYCFNFGAQSSPYESWQLPLLTFEVNAIGVLYLLEAIKKYVPHCRFFSAGSSEEAKTSPYSLSKKFSREIIRLYREKYNVYAIQCTLFNHESVYRRSTFVTRKITTNIARIKNEIDENKTPIPFELGNIFIKRDWSHAEDIIDAIWKIINLPTPKEYGIASGESHSIKEFIDLACQYANLQVEWQINELEPEKTILKCNDMPIIKISRELYQSNDNINTNNDISELKKDLNWVPKIAFNDLVKKMIEYDLKLSTEKLIS